MATDQQSPRDERREQDKAQYRAEGEDRTQPDRNDPRPHHQRTREGDPAQDFNTQGDDGTSDGVSKTTAGDGANNGGPGGPVGKNRQSDQADQGGAHGGGNRQTEQRTPSGQGPHNAGNQQQAPDHGRSGEDGARSGQQG